MRKFQNLTTKILVFSYLFLNAYFCLAAPSGAEEKLHGLSLFGALKYDKDFRHFAYVNPDAPKGGELSHTGTLAFNSFDSLNGFILEGIAAQGLGIYDPLGESGHIFDTLMTRAYDEPDAMYGLVAEAAILAPDRLSLRFILRAEARFHDNTALRAEDVAWSFKLLKEKGHPIFRLAYSQITHVEIINPQEIAFFFAQPQRDLPLVIASLPVFSKKYYQDHDFSAVTMEPPLGSGPYQIGKVIAGRSITYERVKDYWGRDLPVNRGRWNFDVIRYEYFRDRTARFEAFKSGLYDLHEEFTAKTWASEYDIPDIRAGNILRTRIPDGRPSGSQGFFINTRKAKFSDPKLREALGLVFDFEWSNAVFFHKLYQRTYSFFQNSPMEAKGQAQGKEEQYLRKYADLGGLSYLGAPYLPPISDGSGADRNLLRRASQILDQAGWKISSDRMRQNDQKEIFSVEILFTSPTFARILLPYIGNLRRIGVAATIREIDNAQYVERVKNFDFDIMISRFVLSPSPGVELTAILGTKAASQPGSRNYSGINNPLLEALVEEIRKSPDRASLYAAARCIDRVFRSQHYWVPHWYNPYHNLAFWNKFSWPENKPPYARAILDRWWVDEEKQAKLNQNR